jgi:hypothetical protein
MSTPAYSSGEVVVLVERSEEVLLASMWKINSEDQNEYMQDELNLENKYNLEYYSTLLWCNTTQLWHKQYMKSKLELRRI